jgi:two-component system sensor histidine kinase TctE
MLAPLLLWPMSIAVTYLVAKTIANGRSTARWRPTRTCSRGRSTRSTASPSCAAAATRDFLRADNVDSVYYQVLGTRGELAGEADMPLPREEDRPPPGVVVFRDDLLRGNDVRVAYTTVAADAGRPAAGAGAGRETLDKRNALANDIIKGVILPQFVILPLAILLVWFGLSRGLAPLNALQAHIRARGPTTCRPSRRSARRPRSSRSSRRSTICWRASNRTWRCRSASSPTPRTR